MFTANVGDVTFASHINISSFNKRSHILSCTAALTAFAFSDLFKFKYTLFVPVGQLKA